MNRAVPIVLLSLFVTCFVGSLAAGSLALIGAVREAANTLEPLTVDRPAPPEDDPLSSEPGPASDPTPAVDATPAVTPEAVPWQAPVLATGQFAVFHVGKAKVDGWKALQKALKGTKLAAYDDEAPDEAEPPYLVFHALPVDDYAVITGEALDTAWGLSTPQKTQLRGAQSASVVDFVLPLHDASLLEVTKVAAALADATGGVLWDEECQEYFSPAQWRMRRIASWDKTVPQVSLLSVLRESEDGALRTAGLSHLGLPDLRLSHVSPEAREQALNFLQLAAQQLAEARVPVEPGITMIRLEGISCWSSTSRARARRPSERAPGWRTSSAHPDQMQVSRPPSPMPQMEGLVQVHTRFSPPSRHSRMLRPPSGSHRALPSDVGAQRSPMELPDVSQSAVSSVSVQPRGPLQSA